MMVWKHQTGSAAGGFVFLDVPLLMTLPIGMQTRRKQLYCLSPALLSISV